MTGPESIKLCDFFKHLAQKKGWISRSRKKLHILYSPGDETAIYRNDQLAHLSSTLERNICISCKGTILKTDEAYTELA